MGGGVIALSSLMGQACQPQTQTAEVGELPAIPVRSSFQATMAELVTAFLQSLDSEQQREAMFPFEAEERFNWHYVPRQRQGMAFKQMSAQQRQTVDRLLQFSLSEVGYRKVQNILTLETVLREMGGSPSIRDPELYFVTVFGNPAQVPWGWRLEGHHLSLNIAVISEAIVTVTPAFLGANPAKVQVPLQQGLRALPQEQDLAFELLQSLSSAQRQQLILADQSFGDILTGPGRSVSLERSAGLLLSDMETDSRDRAIRLIETYVRNLRDDLATVQLQQIQKAGIDQIRFAWAGALEPQQAHYYRFQGPTVLIEYDNTQNNANHIHTVWHDLRNNFGMDVLRSHYEQGIHAHHPII